MTTENLKNQVDIGAGQLQEGFQHPLVEFKGTLQDYVPETVDQEGRKSRIRVNLQFGDVEAIRTREPYPFPIATLPINFSNQKNSGWGVFSESVAVLLSEDQDIKDCVGKMMHLDMEEGHVYGQDRNTGEDLVGNPWKVVELEGVVAGKAGVAIPTAKDRAKELLVGKTRAEFNKAAYADPIIRKDTSLQRAITDKSFITSLVQLGEVEEDENGVFRATGS